MISPKSPPSSTRDQANNAEKAEVLIVNQA
jgi:hypothetical protein